MSKKSIKKILICIIAISMVVFVATKAFASENILDKINEMKQNGNTSAKEDENVQDIPEGEVKKEPENKVENNNKLDNVLNTSNDKANENTKNVAPTTTPYTGVGDYSTYIFIGVFAISAIYAYKKIREN